MQPAQSEETLESGGSTLSMGLASSSSRRPRRSRRTRLASGRSASASPTASLWQRPARAVRRSRRSIAASGKRFRLPGSSSPGACDDRGVTPPLAHWDEVEPRRSPKPGAGGDWSFLGEAAGSVGIGVNRIRLGPDEVSTPAHVHGADEETFFVLGGSGPLVAGRRDVRDPPRRHDSSIRRATKAHTLRGGAGGPRRPRVRPAHADRRRLPAEGRDLLAVAVVDRGRHGRASVRPRAAPRVARAVAAAGQHRQHRRRRGPVRRPLEAARRGPRARRSPASTGRRSRRARRARRRTATRPRRSSSSSSTASGELELWAPPDPKRDVPGEPVETHPVRRGHVVSRPPGTRVAHSFQAGESGLTYLAYGTEGLERHLLVPALEQDLLPRPRGDRPARARSTTSTASRPDR